MNPYTFFVNLRTLHQHKAPEVVVRPYVVSAGKLICSFTLWFILFGPIIIFFGTFVVIGLVAKWLSDHIGDYVSTLRFSEWVLKHYEQFEEAHLKAGEWVKKQTKKEQKRG